MKQLDIFNDLPLPKNNTQELLFILIQQGNISIMDMPHLSGFRTRISELELKHGLKLSRKMITKRNKFGNVYQYANHILNDNNKKKAVELYKKINQ
jgi:hypothetical protein